MKLYKFRENDDDEEFNDGVTFVVADSLATAVKLWRGCVGGSASYEPLHVDLIDEDVLVYERPQGRDEIADAD